MTTAQAFGAFIMFIGLAVVAIRVVSRQRTLNLHRVGVTTTATVTSVQRRSGGDAGMTYYQTGIRFRLENGRETYERLNLGAEYWKGKELNVIYDPDKQRSSRT